MDWSNALECLEFWAKDRGYHVEFTKNGDDSLCYINKIIEINSSSTPENQVYRLLHECGHVLIIENSSVINFDKLRIQDDDHLKKSVYFKSLTVIEEAEAWKRGIQLAKRLNIPIDYERFESSMIKAISKYIRWACN